MSAPSDWCPAVPPIPAGDRLPTGRPGSPGSGDLRNPPRSVACAEGLQAQTLTAMVTELLVRYFGDVDNIESPHLRRAVWQDNRESGILVESVGRYLAEFAGERPALLIKLNARKTRRIAIGDRAGTDPHGFPIYQTIWVGSHTIFAIQETAAAAELLATLAARQLLHYHPVLVQRLNLMTLQVGEVGEAGIVEEARQAYGVPINLGWAFKESWKLSNDSLKVLKIPIEFAVGSEPL